LEHFTYSKDLETLVPFIKNALKYQPELKLWAIGLEPPTWMNTISIYAGEMSEGGYAAERPETRTLAQEGTDHSSRRIAI